MFWSRGSAANGVPTKAAEKSLVKPATASLVAKFGVTPDPWATVSGVVIHPAGVRELSAPCSAPSFAPGSGRIEAKYTCSPSANPYAPKMRLLSSLTAGVTSSYARQSGRFAEGPKRSAAFGHASSALAFPGASAVSAIASAVNRSAARVAARARVTPPPAGDPSVWRECAAVSGSASDRRAQERERERERCDSDKLAHLDTPPLRVPGTPVTYL